MDLSQYLGPNSYVGIKEKFFNKIVNSQASTIRGGKLLSDLQDSLNESNVLPMMEIKKFETNAEIVSKEDANISEILKYFKNEKNAGDYNYLINLCKEEHFANLSRNGVPKPESTISEIQDLFDLPSNEVIEAIKNNAFGDLNSELYGTLKEKLGNVDTINPDLGFKKSKNKIRKVVTAGEMLQTLNESVLKFNPIAVKYVQPESNIFLTPFSAFEVSVDENQKNVWKPVNPELPPTYQAMQTALQHINYNHQTGEFHTTEGLWDFEMCIDEDGECQLLESSGERIHVEKTDLQKLFLESIPHSPNPALVEDLTNEADRFVMLANNYNKLMKLTDISVIKNDNYFIVVDDLMDKPEIVSSSESGEYSFKTFNKMLTQLNENFGTDVSQYFQNQLKHEEELIAINNDTLMQLNENQQLLNEAIIATKDIYDVAEDGSPAKIKAGEELKELNESLTKNLTDLREHKTKPLY